MTTTLAPETELLTQAQELLERAQLSADRRRELLASTDMGVVYLRGGDIANAVKHLEPALAVARELNDRLRELDVLNYLGMVSLKVGQHAKAIKVFERVIRDAQAESLPYVEKLAWEHLGSARLAAKERDSAIAAFSSGARLALDLRDEHHAADLLWMQAIAHAAENQRAEAIACAQEALTLYQAIGNPFADRFEQQLQRFEQGQDAHLPQLESIGRSAAQQPVATATTPATPSRSDPGLLTMALSAAKSIRQYFSSGMKTVSKATHAERLETCQACEHFTGVRCGLCGCFCTVKAWMPHEACPVQKWSTDGI